MKRGKLIDTALHDRKANYETGMRLVEIINLDALGDNRTSSMTRGIIRHVYGKGHNSSGIINERPALGWPIVQSHLARNFAGGHSSNSICDQQAVTDLVEAHKRAQKVW